MNRRFSRFCSASLAYLLAFGLVPFDAAPAVAGPAPTALKIAIAVPITAGAVELGAGIRDGAQLAIAQYAAELESAGVTVTASVHDDMGDPQTAVAEANAIVADGSIVGVVGHLNSGCSIPASDYYDEHSMAMITPAGTNPALTQRGLDTVFRTVANDSKQGPLAADVAYSRLRLRTAYVVDDSTPYGESLAASFRSRFKAVGGTVAGFRHTSDTATRFTKTVAIIKAKRPDVVFYGGIYNAGSMLARQLKNAGVSAVFMGGDGLYDPEFVRLTGTTRASGATAVNVGLPIDVMPGGDRFSADYEDVYGHAPVSPYDAYAYDAAAAILEGIVAVAGSGAPTTTAGWRTGVRARVAQSAFDGVTGPIGFTSTGDTKYPAIGVYRVKSGVWRSCALVGRPALSASPRSGVRFEVSGKLRPRHLAGSDVVKLRLWHRESGRWVLRKSVIAQASDDGVFSRYAVAVRLRSRGLWRISAEHSDALHPTMRSTVRGFSVK